jgi:hypothetical protein
LAIAVIAIGMVSIMGLFPIGLSANKDAMAKSYAAESADEFLHYLERYLREDWAANYSNADYIPAAEPADADKVDFSLVSPPPNVTQLTPSLYLNADDDGIYKAIRYLDDDGDGQYDSGEIVDFEAIVAVWREQIDIDGSSLAYDYGLKLVMEISWPAKVPYANRSKDEYVLELFNR